MNKFTKKWDKYINLEWKENLIAKAISVIYPSEIYDGNFNEKLLQEEFEKYYNSKVRYSSMYDDFEKKFKDYEKIELLSKEEEFKNYKKSIEEKAEQYKKDFIQKIEEYSAVDFNQYKIQSLESFNIEDADFKLLALGKVNKETRDTYRKSMPQYQMILATEDSDKLYDVIFDIDINKFLTTYEDFFNNEFDDKNISYIDELCEAYCDEYEFLNIKQESNNVTIELLKYDDNIIKIIFENANIQEEFLKKYKNNQNNIYVTTHYIKKYSDCFNVIFEYIEHTYIDNDFDVIEDKFEITYEKIRVSINKR